MPGRTTRLTDRWLVPLVGTLLFWLLNAPTAAASCGSITYEGAPAPAPARAEPPGLPELPSHVCVSTLPDTASVAAALAVATAHGIRLYRSGATPDTATAGTAGPDTERVIRALALQGHAPQRHLFPDTAALKARKGRPIYKDGSLKLKPSGHVRTMDHVDPACDRGTCTREVKPNKSTLPDHYCGDYATKFHDPADFVRAEAHLRAKVLKGSPDLVEATIEEIFGPGDHTARFEGYYIDPANPKSDDGSINLLPVDFRGGYISALYKQTPDSIWLRTMHPSPQDERHP